MNGVYLDGQFSSQHRRRPVRGRKCETEEAVVITIGNCLPGDPSQDDGRNVGLLPALFPEDSNKWVNEAG